MPTPRFLARTFRSIRTLESHDTPEPVGIPTYRGQPIDTIEPGMIPSEIRWTTDRGNWLWEGALIALSGQGFDPAVPIA